MNSLLKLSNDRLTYRDIRRIRRALGLSQDQLSKSLDLSLSTITQWEQNLRKISKTNQLKLLELYNYVIGYDQKERESKDGFAS